MNTDLDLNNSIAMYDDAAQVISHLIASGLECKVFSHETRFSYTGSQYNLHDAASKWTKDHMTGENGIVLLHQRGIRYHKIIEEKIAQVEQEDSVCFLCNLPGIIQHNIFSKNTKGILFDPVTTLSHDQIVNS